MSSEEFRNQFQMCRGTQFVKLAPNRSLILFIYFYSILGHSFISPLKIKLHPNLNGKKLQLQIKIKIKIKIKLNQYKLRFKQSRACNFIQINQYAPTSHPQMKKIKINDFEILTTLGIGSFGRVRLIKHKQSGKFFAAKILKKIEILKSKQIDHLHDESVILSSLNHPFIVQMEGFSQDPRYVYIILEYIPGGQLLTHLRNVVRLDGLQASLYAAQIVMIFEHLHQKNIIYRDLKPQNLLLAEDGYLKLTDFSFAKVIQTRTYTLCGTPQYLAPQILLNQGHGKAVDWWTLGILIYEMNAGIDPFTDQDPMIIYQNILKGKIKFPKELDKQAKSIIKLLLVADVSKRLGMLKNGVEDVKQHKWFNKVDWKALLAKKTPMSYKPLIKGPGDTSNFNNYPESDNANPSPPLKPNQDPFLQW